MLKPEQDDASAPAGSARQTNPSRHTTAAEKVQALAQVPELHPDEMFQAEPESTPQSAVNEGCITVGVGSVDKEVIERHWVACASEEHPYPGLGAAGQLERHWIAGLRCTGLAVRLATCGSGTRDFVEWLSFLDSLLPGEWGNINHSRRFAAEIIDDLCTVVMHNQVLDLHEFLPALRRPSDWVRAADGATMAEGTEVQTHLLMQVGRQGYQIQPLDAYPIPGKSGRPVKNHLVLPMHTAAGLAEAYYAQEYKYGMGKHEVRTRFAGNKGDGLVEGPFGANIGLATAQLFEITRPENEADPYFWGGSDIAHRVEKSATHADAMEASKDGLIFSFRVSAAKVRHHFNYGMGKIVAAAVAKKHSLPWRAPLAQHSEPTRMAMFEPRIMQSFFDNLRVAAGSYAFRVAESIENARRASSKKGHATQSNTGEATKQTRTYRAAGFHLLDPAMLVFNKMREEVRVDGVIRVAKSGQAITASGSTILVIVFVLRILVNRIDRMH